MNDDPDQTIVTDITDARPEQDVKAKVPRAHEKPAPFAVMVNGPNKGKKYLLIGRETLVGRSSRNHIQIEDRMVSAEHAVIRVEPEGVLIQDLESTNGTLVNGRPAKTVYLQNGDMIRFGKIELRVTIPIEWLKSRG
jgi:pSer/pThr/pTyr-binding forkhead associated (FHA) protein